jgi:hypothetical protein
MHDLQRDGPDSGGPFEPTTDAERRAVRPERVAPTVSAPVLDGRHGGDEWDGRDRLDAGIDLADEDGDVGPARDGVGSASEVPWSTVLRQPRNVVVLVGGAAAAAVAWLLSGDAGSAFWSGLVAAFLVGSQIIDRVPFSFGQGFVGYRPDMAWPQGVQEDDDVHWNWRPHAGRPGAGSKR